MPAFYKRNDIGYKAPFKPVNDTGVGLEVKLDQASPVGGEIAKRLKSLAASLRKAAMDMVSAMMCRVLGMYGRKPQNLTD